MKEREEKKKKDLKYQLKKKMYLNRELIDLNSNQRGGCGSIYNNLVN